MNSESINQYQSDLRNMLQNVPEWQRIAFMACCCQRMLPNFYGFSSETGDGDPSVLEDGLNAIWNFLLTGEHNHDYHELVKYCDEQAPDTELFSSSYVSAALDAANAISITLEAIDDPSVDRAIEVASLARETVDMLIQNSIDAETRPDELEKLISESPMMKGELEAQLLFLKYLTSSVGERREIAQVARSMCAAKLVRGN